MRGRPVPQSGHRDDDSLADKLEESGPEPQRSRPGAALAAALSPSWAGTPTSLDPPVCELLFAHGCELCQEGAGLGYEALKTYSILSAEEEKNLGGEKPERQRAAAKRNPS